MSLHNAICGFTPGHDKLLAYLAFRYESLASLTEADIRYRDCYLSPPPELNIVLYTRIGGGNRERFHDIIELLRKHPDYIRDYDDSFDVTFAYFEFRNPMLAEDSNLAKLLGAENVHNVVAAFYQKTVGTVGTPRERFDRIMRKMSDPNTPADDPEFVRANEVGKRIAEQLKQNHQVGVITVNADGSITSVSRSAPL